MDAIAERSRFMTRSFGLKLKQRRQALKFTLEDMALATGVNRRFIGELEAGKPTCEIGRAFLVARALGFFPEDFLALPAEVPNDDAPLP